MAKAKQNAGTKHFKKVLVANRGEIACRVMSTLQEMGITAVAVYSTPDRLAGHTLMADEAYHLPGKTSAETYLQCETILDLCKKHNVDAVHPGYGFLSENAEFARACAKAGVAFIGPSPEAIHAMGDKIIAKETMINAEVPVVPGWSGDLSSRVVTLANEADKIGFPLLVKAAAGGGGKGMRRVDKAEDLKAALEAAGREAKNAFGDDRVFLEKYIIEPRHIEYQVFGDTHGNTVHLFERECSIQRRYQKIVEEAPSPALTPEIRSKMGEAAVKAAKALDYTNAGTVEFILDASGNFYFLEVNTRLQVEHPVTELTTQTDLVRLQVLVAQGEALPFKQEDLKQYGHALECRIYAEDPSQNFMPSVGELSVYRPPSGPGIRVDDGYPEGYEVTVNYDPMLAKLIVWAKDRPSAIEKMNWALLNYVVLGVTTNIAYLRVILEHPQFIAGNIHTHFLDDYNIALPENVAETELPEEVLAVLSLASSNGNRGRGGGASDSDSEQEESPWTIAGSWRMMQ